MNLREKQAEFLTMVSKLVSFCCITNRRVFINELYRSKERQAELYGIGRSKTINSKHLIGLAIDLVLIDENGKPDWNFEHYIPLGEYWEKLGGIWGGRWKLKDGVHFEYQDKEKK